MATLEFSSHHQFQKLKTPNYGMVHTCKKCTYVTKSLFSIINHIKRHRIPKALKLFDCTHSTPETFVCKDCNFTTPKTLEFNVHIKLHQREFKTEENLKHAKTNTDKSANGELLINNTFMNKCQLKITNIPEKEDPKKLQKQEKIKKKSPKQTGEKYHYCGECSFKSLRKHSVARHKLAKHVHVDINWHKCKQCPYRTKFLEHLNGHISRRHSSPGETKVYYCDQCSKKFKQTHYLQKHKVQQHPTPAENQWFQCELCSFGTPVLQWLKQHVKRQHVSRDEWFKCDQCSFQTQKKEQLYPHKKQHSGTVYSCKQCSFQTKHKKCLQTHVLFKHVDDTDVNWFVCDVCSYKCKTKGNLKEHIILVHKPEHVTWFHCDKCTFKAKLKRQLKAHSVVHVDKKLIKCGKCKFKTKCSKYLRQHELRKHLSD